ncbi:MAG: hypothetical protein V3T21_03830 [Candidatus Margulisiibacteriota bacterium]
MGTGPHKTARAFYRAAQYIPFVGGHYAKPGKWWDRHLNKRLGFESTSQRLEYLRDPSSIIPRMQIKNVTTHQGYKYLLLFGWKNIKSALRAYALGYGGKVFPKDQPKQDFSPLGSLTFNEEITSFADRIFLDAKRAMLESNYWARGYEFGFPGTFAKTVLKLSRLDFAKEFFALGISAAEVGSIPEQKMAKYFDLPRALMVSSVIVEAEPYSETEFIFDFEPILRKLNPIYIRVKNITGEEVVRRLMARDFSSSKPPSFEVWTDRFNLHTTIGLADVGERFTPDPGSDNLVDNWRQDGSKLFGPLKPARYDKTRMETPKVVISTRPLPRTSPLGLEPLVTYAGQKEQIIKFSNIIAEAMRQL